MIALASCWLAVGLLLASSWLAAGCAVCWLLSRYSMTLQAAGSWLAVGWLFACSWLAVGCTGGLLLASCWITWQAVRSWLAVGWLLAGRWLADGWLLAVRCFKVDRKLAPKFTKQSLKPTGVEPLGRAPEGDVRLRRMVWASAFSNDQSGPKA